jgi:hypothetical protein
MLSTGHHFWKIQKMLVMVAVTCIEEEAIFKANVKEMNISLHCIRKCVLTG